MKPVRFHFIYTFRILKKGLPLLLLPMLRLLFRLDWENFLIALQQNILLLLFLFILAIYFWFFTSCQWSNDEISTRQGFFFKRAQVFNASEISAVVLRRPLPCRVFGATRVFVYFNAGTYPKKYWFYLHKKDAIEFRNTLFPPEETARAVYSLSGAKRFAFIFLSADIISSFVLGFLGWRQISQLFKNDELGLFQLAMDGFFTLEQIVALLLPAGIAVLVSLLFILAIFTIIRSFFQTANYKARRYQSVLQTSYGLIEHTETTIRLSSISYCDVRHTPFSRILRYHPVHIAAGRFKTKELPLLICKSGRDDIIQGLVPQWHTSDNLSIANNGPKSIMTYLWFPFSFFTFFTFLLIAAGQFLPDFLHLFILPCFLFFGSCLAHFEAYFFEGIAKHPSGGITISSTRFFTRHRILFLGNDYSFKIFTNPVGLLAGRCNLLLLNRTTNKIRVRGVSIFTANNIPINRN